MSLPGKVAIITGGTKGIGAAIATKFVKEGASVVVNYGSDSAAAEALVKELGSDHALAVQGDASKVAEIEKIVKSTVDKFGKIDVLIANAGTMPMIDLEHLTEETYQRVIDINLKGPIFLAQV
jgi:3-oxoacyl-[acyl-carrier protein] reductase